MNNETREKILNIYMKVINKDGIEPPDWLADSLWEVIFDMIMENFDNYIENRIEWIEDKCDTDKLNE